jgi:Phospholipase_D-nuclease N-terminal
MLAALVLLLSLAILIGWEILCLGQVVLAERVRFLPRWLWAVACLIFIPIGGIFYLLVGRVWTRGASAGPTP